jgi:hypothetical protein
LLATDTVLLVKEVWDGVAPVEVVDELIEIEELLPPRFASIVGLSKSTKLSFILVRNAPDVSVLVKVELLMVGTVG